MTRSGAIAWKEWREARPFLGIAWFLFIVLPIIGGVEDYLSPRHRFEFLAIPWVFGLAPVLAVLLGVYCTTRDVQERIEDFWQSRPITPLRLFGVKYAVNAAVLLAAGVVPALIELATDRDKDLADWRTLWLAGLWIAAFSLAFAIGCIVRKAAHAAAVGMVAMLLLLAMPVILPPLAWLHVGQVEAGAPYHATRLQAALPQLRFAGGMLLISAAAAVAGVAAVRREWKIDSSRPLIYTAISAAFLLLVGSASYQLGTNLPVQGDYSLPRDTYVVAIIQNGAQALARCGTNRNPPGLTSIKTTWRDRPIEIAPQGLRLGMGNTINPNRVIDRLRISDVDPTVGYDADVEYDDHFETASLQIYRGLDLPDGPPPTTLPLWRVPKPQAFFVHLFLANRRLYVVGSRTNVFDISDPLHPRRVLDQPNTWRPLWNGEPDPVATFALPPAPGLSAVDRLRFLVDIESGYQYSGMDVPFDGSVWVRDLGDDFSQKVLAMYRLRLLTESQVVFDRVATYKPTLVQSIVGNAFYTSLSIQNHLLYAATGGRGVSVFDLAGPRPMQLVAHFVSRGQVSACWPLADGRILAAGSDVWLLGSPPGEGGGAGNANR